MIINNIWNIYELRLKILTTLFFIMVYRLCSYIPLPGIDPKGVKDFMSNVKLGSKGLMQILSSFTGGAFNRVSVLSLGIMPYISASIVIQLMSLAIPFFQKLQKEGNSGRMQIIQITKWLTLCVCLIQIPAYLIALTTSFIPFTSSAYLLDISSSSGKIMFWLVSIIVLTTGTFFTMWLGERITYKGIGNGCSLLIMSGILSRLPSAFSTEIVSRLNLGYRGLLFLFFEGLSWLLVIMFCILIIQVVRRVNIRYVGRIYHYYTNVQYIPLKLTSAGVVPIIFAQSIMFIPITLLSVFKNVHGFWYNFVFAFFIILFTFFYTAVSIPVNQISDDLKRIGCQIPRVKPGKDTADYLDDILSKITFPGAILLAMIAILPSIIVHIGVTPSCSLFYGGTSLLIIVSGIIDTIQQINSYLLNKHYDELLQNRFIKIF